MFIRYLLALLLIPSLCFSQSINSLDAVYQQYYETALLTNSPSGQYVVLNHTNTYGKDEDELFDVKNGRRKVLDKHRKYQFLDDSYLLMQNMEHSRFQHLKTAQYRDIIGVYTYPATITKEGQILLHSVISGELVLTSKDGQSYSNRNGNERTLNHHLGIFNINEGRWDYRPDTRQKLPVYRFLNEKGDFLLYDKSGDVVEEQQNVILDMNLILDYGKSSYPLPKKRIEGGSYF